MSTFGKLLKGAAASNTIQWNAGFVAIWTWLWQTGLFESHPEAAFWGGIANAIINKLFRAKTTTPLSQRANN